MMRPLNDSVVRYLKIQGALKSRPMGIAELSRHIGCTYEAARRWVVAFLDAGAIEFKGFGPRGNKGISPSLYGWKQ